jgi:acetylornithine deacetylase
MEEQLISAAGIPTVVFGPGGEGSHPAVGWAHARDVELFFLVLPETAADLCA